MKTIRIKLGLRFAAPALLAMSLAGCFGGGADDEVYSEAAPVRPQVHTASALPQERGTNHVESQPGQMALQCVPYAREHSQIKIVGDANVWWDKAAGKYERGATPATGAVMVLFHYSASNSGHVAVVRRVVSEREIRIDHANWLDDGSIYVNDPVVDVSDANDWSRVKVWNIKTGSWGTKTFPVQGFIGSGSAAPPDAPQETVPDELVADSAAPAAPAERVAAAAPSRPRPKPARAIPVKVTNPIIPAAMTPDDRNPAPDSGFALTDEDKAIPQERPPSKPGASPAPALGGATN